MATPKKNPQDILPKGRPALPPHKRRRHRQVTMLTDEEIILLDDACKRMECDRSAVMQRGMLLAIAKIFKARPK